MSQLIDRRQNAGKKSTVNRQRFLRRYKSQIKKAVSEAVGKRSITEIDQGEQITIPAKDIYEPQFHRGHGGHIERVLPGNDNFIAGDRIKDPAAVVLEELEVTPAIVVRVKIILFLNYLEKSFWNSILKIWNYPIW